MNYAIQQELARGHHGDLLREATQARLAEIAKGPRDEEPRPRRFDFLRSLAHRRAPVHRPVPAS